MERSLGETNKHVQSFEGEVADIWDLITQKDAKIKEIEEEKDRLSNENSRINAELNSIKSSVTWKMVMKWHSFIVRLLPQGTRRRRWYDLGIIELRKIANEGMGRFWWKKPKEQIAKSTEGKILETFRDRTEVSEKSLETFKGYQLLHLLSQPDIKLSFPKFEEPIVSIITLTFNKAAFTYQHLESILAHTDVPYELIIVDKGSTDETTYLLDRVENVTIIKNNENSGFIKGCNQGANKAKGKYLLFLNNDVIVTPGWLSNLVKTIENYPKCGAVGCKLIWHNGKLQEAGSIIWSDGSALGYGQSGL